METPEAKLDLLPTDSFHQKHFAFLNLGEELRDIPAGNDDGENVGIGTREKKRKAAFALSTSSVDSHNLFQSILLSIVNCQQKTCNIYKFHRLIPSMPLLINAVIHHRKSSISWICSYFSVVQHISAKRSFNF